MRKIGLIMLILLLGCGQTTIPPVTSTSPVVVEATPSSSTKPTEIVTTPVTPIIEEKLSPTNTPVPTLTSTPTFSTVVEATPSSLAQPTEIVTTPVTPIIEEKLSPIWYTTIGVSLAGAEFGSIPGEEGLDYIYPSCQDVKRWTDKGVRLIRYPFRLERLLIDGRLNGREVDKVVEVLECAAENNARLVLDMHNYMRVVVNGEEVIIGSDQYSLDNWLKAWSLLAERFEGSPGLGGYGLMNEPHSLGETVNWSEAAQLAIEEIRQYDQETPIVVAGNCWSSITLWVQCNSNLHVNDPQNKVVYEGHLYLDKDSSGTYTQCQTPQECNIDALQRLEGFVQWCQQNQVLCWVGEFGVPVAESSWGPVVQEVFDYLQERHIGVSLWSAGPWWGEYPLSLERQEADWLIDMIN